MKKHLVLALGVLIVCCLTMYNALAEKCYQPSSHEKPCSDRPNMVSSCDTNAWSETVCTSKRMYTQPKPVPREEVEASSGSTYTIKIDCVKVYVCKWSADTLECFGIVDWDFIPFDKEDKIIDNPNVECPTPG